MSDPDGPKRPPAGTGQGRQDARPAMPEPAPGDGRRRLFLERAGYTQRRVVDAARLLPFLGLFLWLVPLVWPRGNAEGAVGTAAAGIYVFVIWAGLIALGAVLATRIGAATDAQDAVLDPLAEARRTSQQDRTDPWDS